MWQLFFESLVLILAPIPEEGKPASLHYQNPEELKFLPQWRPLSKLSLYYIPIFIF
jgi:hypothetical protein